MSKNTTFIPSTQERLTGMVEIVTYHNPNNGFCVLKIKAQRQRDLVTVIGNCPEIHVGEHLECQGQWVNDRQHGLQFKAEKLHASTPTTLVGMQKYLASGMIKGIGPHFANKLIHAFKEAVFDVIENQPHRLRAVEGIGSKRCQMIIEAWQQQKSIRDIMIFLHSHGVGSARAVRIYKTYGDQAIEKIQENPYRLANDIYGIGFKTADLLAQQLGIEKDALIRAQAGVCYTTQEECQQGHCAVPYSELIAKSSELLQIPSTIIEQAITQEIQNQRLVRETVHEQDLIFLAALYHTEIGISHCLTALRQASLPWDPIDLEKAIPWVEQKNNIQLAASQRDAIKTALQNKITIITGGPGVGKTTVVNSIIKILKAKQCRITLCAPTGRAAKRMSETSGTDAKTIHRLLEFDPTTRGFKHHADNPLQTDYVIVDEASMIDVHLMFSLIKAIPARTALLLVGDIDQLPAVGPGNVLTDLINSDCFQVARMTEIFRQAACSQIIVNAHRINQGEMPLVPNKNSDFFTIYDEEPESILQQLIELVSVRLPNFYRCDPINAIQVLVPMNRGALGTRSLNIELQKTLNPNHGQSISYYGSTYAVKDKVIQNVNNYDKNVFNGDIGTVTAIDLENKTLKIVFDHRVVEYETNELDEISLAYAISIHKSQGSEYPIVVIPITTQHFPLLARNLLYTGVTRGKKVVVIVGQKKAVGMSIKNVQSKQRITTLSYRLSS